ncbi:hypothetical protein, partial [Mesorhizobium sp. M7A.F.Ca.US.005.03.2.1]|uniref:hypothetical protein n=1 Tax=Mesorhizobium sp. M7A.F.Ca.US.005.03.2.1 TaxID=2496737 RepID=UPI0019D081EB
MASSGKEQNGLPAALFPVLETADPADQPRVDAEAAPVQQTSSRRLTTVSRHADRRARLMWTAPVTQAPACTNHITLRGLDPPATESKILRTSADEAPASRAPRGSGAVALGQAQV